MSGFPAFSKGVYYLHGTILCLALSPNLYDFLGAIEGFGVNRQDFEAIASGSVAGSMLVTGKIENCFIFLVGVLLLTVAHYVKVQDRAVPSLAIAACLFLTAREEYLMSTNQWVVQVFQGSFTEMLGTVAVILNGGFGLLHLFVSIGTFLGLAAGNDNGTKRD